jgi:hypothetical protein
VHADNRERLAAGALGPTRVAVFKRDQAGGAMGEIQKILSGVGLITHLRGVGASGIAGSHLPAVGGQDLMRLAELALEQALQNGGGTQRLALRHERSNASEVLRPAS